MHKESNQTSVCPSLWHCSKWIKWCWCHNRGCTKPITSERLLHTHQHNSYTSPSIHSVYTIFYALLNPLQWFDSSHKCTYRCFLLPSWTGQLYKLVGKSIITVFPTNTPSSLIPWITQWSTTRSDHCLLHQLHGEAMDFIWWYIHSTLGPVEPASQVYVTYLYVYYKCMGSSDDMLIALIPIPCIYHSLSL